jgi:hypothetical protein
MEGSMRFFFGLMWFCLSFSLFASTQLITQIHDVDYGEKMGDEILILLKSGHVAKLKQWDQHLIQNFQKSKSLDNWIEITMDDDRYITDIVETEAPEVEGSESDLNFNKNLNYVPTTIENMSVAQKYHREARHSPKDSQCFNRAMVWSYEWWKNHSVKSMKILIFFTRTYIRRYNFEWWFHIAPYVHVMEDGKVTEKVMDVKYTRGPIPFRKWTNIFMRNNAECNVITKYSDYANYPYTGECYIYRTNMYTYQPADLEMNEAWGYTKDSFRMEEVKGAYLEAFDIYL